MVLPGHGLDHAIVGDGNQNGVVVALERGEGRVSVGVGNRGSQRTGDTAAAAGFLDGGGHSSVTDGTRHRLIGSSGRNGHGTIVNAEANGLSGRITLALTNKIGRRGIIAGRTERTPEGDGRILKAGLCRNRSVVEADLRA